MPKNKPLKADALACSALLQPCYSLVPSLEEEQAVTGTGGLFTLVRNCFALVKGSCDKNRVLQRFVRNPPGQ